MLSLHVLDDLRYGQGHDGDGTDGHILGGGKELEGRELMGDRNENGGRAHTIDSDADEG